LVTLSQKKKKAILFTIVISHWCQFSSQFWSTFIFGPVFKHIREVMQQNEKQKTQ